MEIVGREAELAAIAQATAPVLVLEGEPGIGKTAVWRAAVDRATTPVLAATAGRAETALEHVALADLLEGVDTSGLPEPQRRALDVVLLRAEPSGAPPAPRAVASGLLNLLRALSPVLVAVDDAHWLDPASAAALAFGARRAEGTGIRFLLAARTGTRVLEDAERVALNGLDLDGIRRLLADTLDLRLPRRVLADVHATSSGNPLFALELGRALQVEGVPAVGEPLTLPDAVDELLRVRVAGLPDAVRRLVVAVALDPALRRDELGRLAASTTIEQAAGVLVVADDRVRPAHPLLGAAALHHATAAEQRAAHAALGRAVAGDERRAHHLAAASEAPEPRLARDLAAAADRAAGRGAALDADALAEQALRLTPPGAPERPDRVLQLGEQLARAGEDARLTELLTAELDALPPGEPRVRAHVLLVDGVAASVDTCERHLEAAAREAGEDPVLLAPILAHRAVMVGVAAVERLADCERWATEAVAAAPGEPLALNALAWVRALRGHPIADLAERFTRASDAPPHIFRSVQRLDAVRRAWRGDVDAARAAVRALLVEADEHGDAWSYETVRLNLAEVELRAGDWDAAARVLDGWDVTDPLLEAAVGRCRALLAAGRGDAGQARDLAAEAEVGAAAAGVRWDHLEAWRAQGLAAVLEGEPARAAAAFEHVWRHTEREWVTEPGAFPVAPDLVEALLASGAPERAAAVNVRLGRYAAEQEHPWALLGARRGRALLALDGDGDPTAAVADLGRVAAEYDRAGLHFDHARTLLALGRAQRRRRRWAAARAALTAAIAAFTARGATGWARLAEDELGRVAGRRPRGAPDELTRAERRVAELAAQGRSNKEIAQTLVVTVNTVETHLTRAYAKLGVRGRAQLAAKVQGSP